MYLGLQEKELLEAGGINTAREIAQQPQIWKEIFEIYSKGYYNLNTFLDTAFNESSKVILTGAGTSAYIGLSLTGVFKRNRRTCTFAVPTTDIISHPQEYFFHDETILLVSFARSGNSPESIGAVELADQFCGKVFHLIISCAEEGKLVKYKSKNPLYTFLLPPDSNDKGLAMTSSYSGMLLAGMLIAEKGRLSVKETRVNNLCAQGAQMISKLEKLLQKAASLDFKRAVFLGSGDLFGVAKESHLKLQELTDGSVVCSFESFLGFRHGPKAVVDEATLMVYLFSSDDYVKKYELDLISSMKKGKKPIYELGISKKEDQGIKLDHFVFMEREGDETSGDYFPVCAVLPAQILGFYKSLQLGYKPDSPSKSGSISRVVEGVTIYPVS
jgi:tagatose-6-phosphate ketose/aldose isomerase